MNMSSIVQRQMNDDGISEASSATLDHEETAFSSPTGQSDELVEMLPLTNLTELLLRDLDNYPPLGELEGAPPESTVVDLTADDENEDIVDISQDQPFDYLLEDHSTETSVFQYGYYFVVGMSVSLHDNSFLHIESILRDREGKFFLRGRNLRRLSELGSGFPEWDELCWIVNRTQTPPITPLEEVKELTQICFTNTRRHDSTSPYRHGRMTCRLKQIIVSKLESTLMYLDFSDCDQECRIEPKILRAIWRGNTERFGSYRGIDWARTSSQYTFGDGFCGAGGVSSGAQAAGVHVKWSFDKNTEAATTYRKNFPGVICETADIFHFLTNSPDDLRVDLTHCSPPCQPYSFAHTVNGANDDDNSAPIFSSWNLIRSTKPRVHTMEETAGLAQKEVSKPTFHRLIHDFVELGYSVQYKILKCWEYGIPQLRNRLVMIASGPGEALPPFPSVTHVAEGPGYLPLSTIYDAIANIPAGTPDHDVENALHRGASNIRAPYSPHSLARTITCGGGEGNYHPSGRRGFTNRELACLQTFPLSYEFAGKGVRTQIGNAVPPLLARAMYQSIIKSLRETDERELAEENQRHTMP